MSNDVEQSQDKLKYSLFLGCVIPNRYPTLEKASRVVIKELGADLIDMEGASCCPAPGVFRGVDDHVWNLIGSRNITIAEGNNADIVTLCNGCYGSLGEVDHNMKHKPKLRNMINEDLKQIGVKVVPVNVSGPVYWAMMLNEFGYHKNMFHLAYGLWGADYNDPSNFIDPLFRINGDANYGQVNDSQTLTWLEEALLETDPNIRKQLYYDIQKHLIEDVYPIAFSYSLALATIYKANIKGWNTSYWIWPFKNVYFENNN